MQTQDTGVGRSDERAPTGAGFRMFAPDLPHALRVGLKRNALLVHIVKSMRTAWKMALTSIQERRWIASRSATIQEYIDSHSVRKLQIGSGPGCQDGWLNSDIRPRVKSHIFLDATKRFPFPDSTFDYILAEHMVQDLSYQEVGQMLRECARVLRPGGRLRLSTPDLERLCGLYRKVDGKESRYVKWYIDNHARWTTEYLPGFVLNNTFRELRFVFDRASMEHILRHEGFENISFFEPGQSDDSNLQKLEVHGQVLGDEEINRLESLVVEATRPKLNIRHVLLWAIFVTC